jgi:hypothetical protein
MTFVTALMLVDRGLLDLNERVAHYWPEFAAAGKEDVLVRHLLGHTAGLPAWTERSCPEDLADWEKATSLLAAPGPVVGAGHGLGYHLVSQGFLIGEVVRRITGESLGTFAARKSPAPRRRLLHRSAREPGGPCLPRHPAACAGRLGVAPDSITMRALTSPLLDATAPAQRWWRAAEIPAANGHGNAKSVALIQDMVAGRGETQGRRFFSEATSD